MRAEQQIRYPPFSLLKIHHAMRYEASMPGACSGADAGMDKVLPEPVCLVDGIILMARDLLLGRSAFIL